METIRWNHTNVVLLDQTKLPGEESYLTCHTWQEVRQAISILAVRGAPAIGVAAAYAVVLAARQAASSPCTPDQLMERLTGPCAELIDARPTAINLRWAVERMTAEADRLCRNMSDTSSVMQALDECAQAVQAEDLDVNRRLSSFGCAQLNQQGKALTILTHCNAGALATAGIGTALGVIRSLHQKGCIHMVYADETRPLLQGARLTAFELMADHIPVTLITDNMAAWVMKTKSVDAVIVGADRIACNGDTANKIGTYGLSIAAAAHGIPFYIAAPVSTFDFSIATGAEIPIEERNHEEVRTIQGVRTALAATPVFNPAFDVTPHSNIRAIITELGVIEQPDTHTISNFFKEKGVL